MRGALIALCLLLAGPVSACRLALVLALDISSSVDPNEDRLQRQGLAAALTDPDVVAAFLASPDPVALTAFEWSGRYNQTELLPWTMMTTEGDVTAAAARIAGSRRSTSEFPTALGYALGHAAGLLANGPDCAARTVDVAGDGVTNDGFGPAQAYETFPFAGVTVNGFVIADVDNGATMELFSYYRRVVLHGPGAFLESAQGYADYARGMRRKLLRELGLPMIGGAVAAGPAG